MATACQKAHTRQQSTGSRTEISIAASGKNKTESKSQQLTGSTSQIVRQGWANGTVVMRAVAVQQEAKDNGISSDNQHNTCTTANIDNNQHQ